MHRLLAIITKFYLIFMEYMIDNMSQSFDPFKIHTCTLKYKHV